MKPIFVWLGKEYKISDHEGRKKENQTPDDHPENKLKRSFAEKESIMQPQISGLVCSEALLIINSWEHNIKSNAFHLFSIGNLQMAKNKKAAFAITQQIAPILSGIQAKGAIIKLKKGP